MSSLAKSRLSFLERAVWAAGATVTTLSFLFASAPVALAAAAGALVAASNFTASRMILSRLILQPGQAPGLYVLSYVVRIMLVILAVGFLAWTLRASPAGLALGLLSFPAAIFALLCRELVRQFSRAPEGPR